MLLDPHDVELFFRLHRTLLFYVNEQLEVVPGVASPDEFALLPPEVRVKVRDALLERRELLESFVAENPAGLPPEELEIVAGWRYMAPGKFYLFRELKAHTVLLSADDPVVAYGVLALSQPFEEIVGLDWPVLIDTLLLPFKGAIIYDGHFVRYRIHFGPGIRRSLNESYKEAKQRQGIVTSLPWTGPPAKPEEAAKPKPKAGKKAKPAKDQTAEVLQTILGMTDAFCQKHLNDEYAELCRRLAEKLARKRPSPLLSGRPNTWAAGIVRTIGWANFLDDSSQKPHMKLTAIDKAFGIGESTGQQKSMAIRKMLKIRPFDHHWILPSRMESNSLIWMVEVNGLPMDIRRCPREIQEAALEKGLIPYIPADRDKGQG